MIQTLRQRFRHSRGQQESQLLCVHIHVYTTSYSLPWWFSGKESACQCRRRGFDPWVGKIPWRRKWQPTPVFLPGKSHGQRSLVGPWGRTESDTTELLTFSLCVYINVYIHTHIPICFKPTAHVRTQNTYPELSFQILTSL